MAIERTIVEKSCIQAVTLAIKKSRDDAHTGTSSDSDTPLIREPWNAVLQSFAVGTTRDGTARALVTFAIPRAPLVVETAADGRQVTPVQFRVVAYEAQSGATVVLDTLRQFVAPSGAAAKENISGWLELPLTAGTWQVAVRLSQHGDTVGAFGLQRGLIVPEATLAISDILTGVANSPTRWPGDGVGFPLNTLGVWPKGGTVELYYQVHGLPDGTPYRTTLEVRPMSGRDGSDGPTGEHRARHRTADADPPQPGAGQAPGRPPLAHGDGRGRRSDGQRAPGDRGDRAVTAARR